uniref:Uncharacterized protein n=1 Tax=Phytophthora fragariae TaxID=53985 RepID=A0A6A3DXQ7_9STRA|nr:hypothetical protein PF009_g25670 [Phytophthora fragariae]
MSALLLLTFASFCLKACHAYLTSKIACLLLASITTPVQLYFPSTTALVLHSPWVADLHLAWLQLAPCNRNPADLTFVRLAELHNRFGAYVCLPTGRDATPAVQGVQSVLEVVHTTTGLPWWATFMLSGVTVCAAIFPFYVFQIEAMQKARPDLSKLYSAYKYARTFTIVECNAAIRIPPEVEHE